LERLGAAALEALRKAAKSSDVETRRRAETLVKKLEKEASSRELLQAKQVRLRFKDTPLPEAVAELAKKSGYEIALDDPDGKLKERKVTLDTDDMPFWRAVDLLCRAGGVVEADADVPLGMPMFRAGGGGAMIPGMPAGALPAMPILPGPGPAVPVPAGGALPQPAAKTPPAVPIGAAPAPGPKQPKEAGAQPTPPAKVAPPAGGETPPAAPPGGKIVPASETQPAGKALPAAAPPDGKNAKAAAPPAGAWAVRQARVAGPGVPPAGFVLRAPPAIAGVNAPPAKNRLLLKDGKAATSPTAYVGAVRVRPVDANHIIPTPPGGDGEVSLGLRFSLEPKLLWRRLLSLHLKAADDQDQTLEPAADSDATIVYRANLDTSLRLKKGEKPAKSLQELKGTLTAEVFGPIKPIITVDNLLKGGGKTFKGDDGASLEVLEVSKGDDDQITVKLGLDLPADWTPGIAMAGAAAVPLALPAGGPVPPPPAPAARLPLLPAAPAAGAILMGVPANNEQSEISLVDAQGKPVQTTRHILSYRGGDKGFTHMHEFTFRLPKDQDTIKLVFSGRRPVTIDVPFTLKDVPLP
jgi:hypothetical protein